MLALGGPGSFAQTPPSSSVPASPQTRVLVLPFENAGSDARLLWLGEASSVLVADGLKARGLASIGRDDRVRAFEELHLPLSATLSRATVIKVAELLGAGELVTGTFRVQDRTLTIQAHITRVDAGRVRQPVTERGELTDLFELHDRLVRNLTPDVPRSSNPSPSTRPPLGAFENYIKGLVATSLPDRATLSRVGPPGLSRVRARAPVALGSADRPGRSRRGDGGGPGDSLELRAVSARPVLRGHLDAQSRAVR